MTQEDLIKIAKNACKNAYVPLSGYMVGAAVLAKSGTVYIGVNVEDAKIPNLSICAERNAIQNAISHGEREFVAIAVVGKKKDADDFDKTLIPCGICLQYMIDICKEIDIVCYMDGKITLIEEPKDLFKNSFDLDEQ